MGKNFVLACFYSLLQRNKISLVSLFAFISFLSIFVTSGHALADAAPGGNIANPVVRAVDLAKPAVVRIITTVGGRLSVQFTDTQSATFPLNGGYYDLKLSGSGTFISSHGDILTADHVIQPPRDQSMDDVLQMTAAQDVADYINQNFHPTTPYSAQDAYSNMAYGIFRTQSTYKSPKSEVFLSKDYAGVINATQLSDVSTSFHAPVDKIEQESAVDERDVAIIHINMEDTPSVQLGNSSDVAQQDELTIIGFPGNGDLGDPTRPDPNTYLTSSVNKIYVSAIKEHVIQVGGNVEHGDSGGPALDSHGNVVGVVSFYNQDAQAPIGTSFLQASSSAQELLANLKIDTKPGKFQTAWEQAFSQYTSTSKGHWHQAYADFQNIQKNYPDFQAVNPFLNYASQEANHEQMPQPAQNSYMTPLIIAAIIFIGAIIVLALLAWFFLARRRKQPQLAYQYHGQTPQHTYAQAATHAYTRTPQQSGNPYIDQPAYQTNHNGTGSWSQPYQTPAPVVTRERIIEEPASQPVSQPSQSVESDSPHTPDSAIPWPPATHVAAPVTPAFPHEAITLDEQQTTPSQEAPVAIETSQRQSQSNPDNKLYLKRLKTDGSFEENFKDWPISPHDYYATTLSTPDSAEQVPFPLDSSPRSELEPDNKHESTDKRPAVPKQQSVAEVDTPASSSGYIKES